jgi:hypothetical protein
MRVFARRIKHPLDVPIERPHHANARHHCWPVELDDQEQGFDRGLPFLEILLGFRQAGDVVAGIAQSQQLAPTR